MTKKTYEPAPSIPAELGERPELVIAALSGQLTVSECARRLGVSRNHFQSLMHRAQAGLIEGLMPRPPGRPAKPPRESELAQENETLRRENDRLRARVEMIDRLLDATSAVVQGRIPITGRAKKDRPIAKAAKINDSDEDDPGGAARALLECAKNLRSFGIAPILVAALVGVGESTLRRWNARTRRGEPPVQKRGRAHSPLPGAGLIARVADMVRNLRGLVGAESLRRSVPGISRRQAAAIKRDTVRQMERERVEAAQRITITAPGIVRGFDAMHVATCAGVQYPLVAGDACVPYRTSICVAARYDGRSVAEVLDRDFAEHGPPLVLRLDRASCHDVPEVHEVLRRHEVLVLHGPPRHPRFYGQLERQNREHRQWLDHAAPADPGALAAECERMKHALNGAWRRRRLGWKTAAEVWKERPMTHVDRTALRDEVLDRAARLLRERDAREPLTPDLAMRLAIEAALTQRGYLQRELGGWC